MGITFFEALRERLGAQEVIPSPERVISFARLALKVRAERDQLAKLTPEQLADIGLHPKTAKREAERGLFDLPKHRVDRVK